MPRLFWLALLLGYLAGVAGALLFLPGPMVEPLYAGIAIASLAVGGTGLTLVLAAQGAEGPAALRRLARAVAGLTGGPRTEADEEAAPETARVLPHLITSVAEDGIPAAELQALLDQRRVEVLVRPVVGLRRPGARSYHAVARLRASGGEFLEPARYRAMSARHGLLGRIDQLLMAGCVEALRAAHAAGDDQQIFCRISAGSLNDKGFVAELGDLLREEPQVGRRLIVELEQMRLHRPARNAVGWLLERGLQLCLWRLGIEGLDLDQLAEAGFAFVRIEAPEPELSMRNRELDPRLLALRHLLDQAGITLVLDQSGAARRPLASADRPWRAAQDELRSASVA